MSIKEIKEKAREMFDERLKQEESIAYSDYGYVCMECGGGLNEDWVKNKIDQIIDQVVEERDKSLIEKIEKLQFNSEYPYDEVTCKKIINLIKNKNE